MAKRVMPASQMPPIPTNRRVHRAHHEIVAEFRHDHPVEVQPLGDDVIHTAQKLRLA